jgi:methyl-accepting chemotaxis protein
MRLHFIRDMSRLKKKLLLYFILVAIVSVSVSAEIILEMSTSSFRGAVSTQIVSQLSGKVSPADLSAVRATLAEKESWTPLFDLRNRMILLLLVISGSVIGAMYLFTKDIVSPMDGVVAAAKRIAAGDFSASAPVVSNDEIGQMGSLINDMNTNLQDMVAHIKREVDRHREKIEDATRKNDTILDREKDSRILDTKRMNLSAYRTLVDTTAEIKVLLWRMNNDMAALQAYIGSYKTYSIPSEITQEEIESSLREFQEKSTVSEAAE